MSQAINSYKYENEINFNVNDVKNALKEILETNRTRFLHKDKDLNDTFGTYSFGEIKCSYLVTLTKMNDDTTKIVITCSERPGSFHPSMASLESYTSEFLNILSAKLSGTAEEEMKEIVNQNNSDSGLAGCGVICGIVIFILSLAIMFM